MTTTFNDFGLPPKLLQSLARIDFTTPTPIQEQAIPVAMQGKDIIGSAQTGTGKTGAFGIPLIAQLMADPQAHALILTPTRELATQVINTLEQFIPVADIKTALLIGGDAMPKQMRQLNNRPRLIVGTPGRVNDHLERGSLKLNQVKFLVLDETDRMLDMGFGIQLERIIHFIPKQRQTMMFSATMPSNIMALSSKYLTNPTRIAVGSSNTPMASITQEQIHTSEGQKYDQLLDQLDKREGTIILFVKTKFGTERLAKRLYAAGHHADAIHGDLSQRRRDTVIQGFRDKKFRILVATDVAARGLDIPHIAHVINYDLPQSPEDYIHRVGRTARAGAEGCALNFLTPADGIKWKAIQRLIGGKEPSNDEGFKQSPSKKKPFSGEGKKSFRPWDKPKSRSDDRAPSRSSGGRSSEGRPSRDRAPARSSEGRSSFFGDRPSARSSEGRPFRDRAPARASEGRSSFGDRDRAPARSSEGRPSRDRAPARSSENRSFERPAERTWQKRNAK